MEEGGITRGTEQWDAKGICRAVTWPRVKNSILGKHSDGTPLQKDCITTKSIKTEIDRKIKQIRINSENMDVNARKDFVSLLGKEKLPQSLVKQGEEYIISEKHSVSILFSVECADRWIENLDGQDQIDEIYIFTTDNRLFSKIKNKVIEALGTITISKQEILPMSNGFAANAAFFKLDFLDKTAVALGLQFREILPILWMKAGAVGKCPELLGREYPDILILPENRFAVLIDENAFARFLEEMNSHPEIQTAFLITDYEVNYRSMVKQLEIENTYQLYRDYLDNFRINHGRD